MLLWSTTSAQALDFFRAHGDHSLSAVFGLPTAALPTAGFAVSGTYANMFAGGDTADELLLLDGERAEVRFTLYQPINACSGIAFEAPVIAHGEGYFDNAIEWWHELFSLPNGNRDESEQNQLSIFYSDSTSSTQSLTSSSASVGDIHLQYIRPASCNPPAKFLSGLSYRVGVKLPTGDTRFLSGSGAADAYMDISSPTKKLNDRLSVRGAVGILWIGNTDLFSNEESLVAYGSAVLGYRYSALVELKLQTDWHSRMFDSELTELGDFTSQLAFGATWQLQNSAIDFAIQEDVIPDTAPDINLYLSWQRHF